MKINDVELIIFDLDGTLVNSVPDIGDSINHALTTMGRKSLEEKHVEKLVGGGIKNLVIRAFDNTQDEKVFARALSLFEEHYSKNYISKTKPYEGVLEVLHHFSNIKKAVYSNKLHKFTVAIIENLGLDSFFDIVRGADDSKYKPKPSPEGIEYILKELNVHPQNAMIVGDSTHDIHAGKSAGIFTGAVTYGYRKEEILAQENPDFIIHRLTELIKKVEIKG